MKKKSSLLLLLCAFTFCIAQEKTTYTNERGDLHLCGPFEINALKEDSLYAAWFNKRYDEFTLEGKNYSWSNKLKDIEVDIYLGTWCGDSKKWVPSFVKVWDQLGLDRENLNFTALYDTDEHYKQGPNGEEKGKQIHRVPTFIFKRGGEEIARIVEEPQNDLLTDIGQVALGLPSQPNYKAANYLMNLLEEKSVEEVRADINTYFYKTYDYLGKSGELNTLGRVFLHSDRIEEAVLVFEFNFYFFRYDPYIIGSYAKALAQLGDAKKAEELYERALKIDPENKWVKKLYEELKEKVPELKEPTFE